LLSVLATRVPRRHRASNGTPFSGVRPVKGFKIAVRLENRAIRVLVVGLAELVMIIFARHRQVLLSYVLFFAAATLGAAVLLVALDSATYVARLSGYFLGPCSGTWTRHVGYLYFLWGVPLIVLLLQASRVVLDALGFEARHLARLGKRE
jgi:hypothetical protein